MGAATVILTRFRRRSATQRIAVLFMIGSALFAIASVP